MFIILLKLFLITLPKYVDSVDDCWWTGCQKNDWSVRGCESYNRTQGDVRECENGQEFYCCEKTHTPTSNTGSTEEPCWWTGCQKKNWAVRGCEQYNRSQGNSRDCDDGQEYYCCPISDVIKPTTSIPSIAEPSCWWSGCQKNDWAVRGCEQYNRTQGDIRDCKDGHEYYCCLGSQGPSPSKTNDMECWWSSCQPRNLSGTGCPSYMTQAHSEPCEESAGDIFQCCGKLKEVDNEFEIISGESFVNYAKYLLLKSKNFTFEPDSLPCRSVDVEKQSIFKIDDKGIYTCDMCPYFPQRRLVNVFLNNRAFDVKPNINFPDCFGYCFDTDYCVAYSYDHLEHLCYIYNNTVGTFVSEDKWTTVIMTQPVGILESWTYSRHTLITGNVLKSTKESTFQNCLKTCDNSEGCNFVSYYLITSSCDMFSSEESINYIDLTYAVITAIKISSLPIGNDISSRFIEMGEELSISNNADKINNHQQCSFLKNSTHSAFFSKECFMSGSVGCDVTTGCRTCYYPEKDNKSSDLPICPDSNIFVFSEIKKSIEMSMKNCLKDRVCIGVGYNAITKETNQLSFDNLETSNDYTTKFILRYPIDSSDDHRKITQFDFLFQYDIFKLSEKTNSFHEIPGKTLAECLQLFKVNAGYIRMSYSDKKCKLSSEEVKFVFRNGDLITIFKKPTVTSPLISYARTPGFSLPGEKAKEILAKCNNCEEICSKKCSVEFGSWCTHFYIYYEVNKNTCFFFDFLKDSVASNINIQQNEYAQTFTKLSSLDFTLDSLNKLNPFQPIDIYNCFQVDVKPEQTQTTLTPYYESGNSNSDVALRRKRGLFDAIGKAFKKVGEFVVDTVKDVVKPIVDTAKGIGNAIGNVVKGDFEKAKEAVINIPIVQDVKKVVELGGAVITGDWEKAKERGIDLLQSQALDVATSLIPVGGKFIGKGLKTIGKTIKKNTSKIKKSTKKGMDKVNGKDKKVKKETTDKDKEIDSKRNQCQTRHKRATSNRNRSKPGDCKDDNDKDMCPKPTINNVITATTSGCNRRTKNAECDYECYPGYNEPSKDVKCVKQGNKSPFWTPKPDCDLIHCPKDSYPLIPLHTPQVTNFESREFGKHLTAYVVLFDKNRKLPIWSIALHQSTQFQSKDYNSLKSLGRKTYFQQHPCPELQNRQSKSLDYASSGWDKGHLTPANVARWSPKAVLSSNLYINAAPQDPYTNRGVWAKLEAHVECFSKTHRSLVVTGVCKDNIARTSTGLEVPKCFWKMVCYKDENSKEQVVGFISENSHPSTNRDKAKRQTDVYTPVSQKSIRPLFTGSFGSKSPWLYSATEINKGRPIQVGSFETVWFPVNPYDCEKAADISTQERDAWSSALLRDSLDKLKLGSKKRKRKDPKQGNNKKPTRGKRNTAGGIKRGCHNLSELRNMMLLLGLDQDDDEEESNEDTDEFGGGGTALINVQNCNKRIIGYYTSWGEREIEGRHLQRLTHVIYAFLEMKEDGSIEVGSPDRKNSANIDEEINKARDRLVNLMDIAAGYPHIKIMFAVGGWENSQYFSSMAANPGKRVTFIGSIIKLIQKFGFDGVDIDWEYPVTGGAVEGVSQDKENYVILMKEIRNALDNLAKEADREEKFLLSFAGAAGQWTLDPGFDLPGLFKYVDFANIMSYDYFGAWASKWGAYTGPPSPLFFGMPPRFSGKTNLDWTAKYYTCKTNQPQKINIGVPFYGRYWKNVGAPVDGKDGMWRTAAQVNGKFEGGYVAFNKIHSEFLSSGGYEEHFHEKSKTPYAWNPTISTFLGFENEKSLQFKVDYAVKKNVGGLMIWAIELDDDDLTLLDTVSEASLCDVTDSSKINFKCSPIDEKRWWTSEDGDDKAGLCGKSAPLYKGYYPVCDPDDPGYSCCGPAGYCGSGDKYCDCATCKNYGENPEKILDEPIKPSVPVTWYFLDDPEGKRGRCGRKIPMINGVYPTCNPDDENAFCCSNGGYCGSKDDHCKCNGCINFKTNPQYRYGPKKWWELADGDDKAGKCGPKAPKVDGIYEAECEPNTNFNCCSASGYCGSGPEFCDCPTCKRFT